MRTEVINIDDIPNEYDGEEMQVHQVKQSKALQKYTGWAALIKGWALDLAQKMTEKPEHGVSQAILAEFGTIEEYSGQAQVLQEEQGKFLGNLLKILIRLFLSDDGPKLIHADEYTVERMENYESNKEIVQPVKENQTEGIVPQTSRQRQHQRAHSGTFRTQRRRSVEGQDQSAGFYDQKGNRGERMNDFVCARSVIAEIRGNKRPKIKQVFNPYTKKHSEFFDPYIQYGGKSMYRRSAK